MIEIDCVKIDIYAHETPEQVAKKTAKAIDEHRSAIENSLEGEYEVIEPKQLENK